MLLSSRRPYSASAISRSLDLWIVPVYALRRPPAQIGALGFSPYCARISEAPLRRSGRRCAWLN